MIEAQSSSYTNKIALLDRDGTINRDPGYLSDPNLVELIEGVAVAIGNLSRAGYRIALVSNQSSIGRGFCTLEDVNAVNHRISEKLRAEDPDAVFDKILFCPHSPYEDCKCRKPKTGLIPREWKNNIRDFGFIAGDKITDMEFGENLSIPSQRRFLLLTGEGRSQLNVKTNVEFIVAKDLLQVVESLLKT